MTFCMEGMIVKILVEHEVPCDKGLETTCKYAGDFWGNDVCRYHTHRDRTHGRKAPIERHIPKCTLFDEWLSGEYQKCERCLAATNANKPLTLEQLQKMDGQPVWVVDETWRKTGCWGIVSPSSRNASGNQHIYIYDVRRGAMLYSTQEYGRCWTVFRDPPERGGA